MQNADLRTVSSCCHEFFVWSNWTLALLWSIDAISESEKKWRKGTITYETATELYIWIRFNDQIDKISFCLIVRLTGIITENNFIWYFFLLSRSSALCIYFVQNFRVRKTFYLKTKSAVRTLLEILIRNTGSICSIVICSERIMINWWIDIFFTYWWIIFFIIRFNKI